MLALQLLIVLLSFISVIYSIVNIKNRKINSAIVFSPIFFVLYTAQIYLDIFYGMPNYEVKFYNLKLAYENSEANILYLLFILVLTIVLLFFQLKLRRYILSDISSFFQPNKIIKTLLYIIIISPIVFALISPIPSVYLMYGEIRGYVGTPIYVYHNLIVNLTLLSALIVIYLRFVEGSNVTSIKSLIFFSILLLDVYLNNKRTVMLMLLAYFFLDYYYSRNGKLLNNIKLFVGVLFFLFSYTFYANNIKYDDGRTVDEYLQYRVEFGRDDILKYSIYKTIVLGEDILDYKGQTLLGSLAVYLPRRLWDEKPYPYAQYLTNSLVWNENGPSLNGWTLTTSVIDELISNFKSLGFFIVVLFYVFALIYSNNFLINFKSLLFFCVFILWHFVHVVPFAPLLYFFIALTLRDFFRLLRIR